MHNILLHVSCSGTQHHDCVRLLQRLQAAAKQAASPSKGESHAPAAAGSAAGSISLSPDKSGTTTSGSPPKTLLAIHSTKGAGRQLAVTKGVAAGSVLWKEQPYVQLLLKQHRKQV